MCGERIVSIYHTQGRQANQNRFILDVPFITMSADTPVLESCNFISPC